MTEAIEAIREPLDRLVGRVARRVGVKPSIQDNAVQGGSSWLWADRIPTSVWPARGGTLLEVGQESLFKNVLRWRVRGIILPSRGPEWSRLYLAEPLFLEQVGDDGIPRGLNRRLYQAVLRAWQDTHNPESLEEILPRLRQTYDHEYFD